MVNLHQKDKNEKQHAPVLPYDKEGMNAEDQGLETTSEAVTAFTPDTELTGSEFLLSIAGIFSSGFTDTSERVEEYVTEAIKKKFS